MVWWYLMRVFRIFSLPLMQEWKCLPQVCGLGVFWFIIRAGNGWCSVFCEGCIRYFFGLVRVSAICFWFDLEDGVSMYLCPYLVKNADYADAGVSRLRNASLSPSATCFASLSVLLKARVNSRPSQPLWRCQKKFWITKELEYLKKQLCLIIRVEN